ncbi:Uncharacterised protein [Mycobacteroides abscessus subsp. abscessus]|nr:Uncharacterised protein [Mycobacteroides abscessus subsp. abscessus]
MSSLPLSRFSRPSASTAGFAALEVLQQLAWAWESFVIVGCLSCDQFSSGGWLCGSVRGDAAESAQAEAVADDEDG